MSNHKLIKVQRFTKLFKQCPRYVKKRSFNEFDNMQYKQRLSQANLEDILECSDLDDATEILTSELTNIPDEMEPIKTFQTRTNYSPWLQEETKLLKEQREAAQSKAAQTDDPEDWRNYRSLRNQELTRNSGMSRNGQYQCGQYQCGRL